MISIWKWKFEPILQQVGYLYMCTHIAQPCCCTPYRFRRLIWSRIRTNTWLLKGRIRIEFSDVYNEFDFWCVFWVWEMLENSYLVEIWSNRSVHYHVDACAHKNSHSKCVQLERWNQYFKSRYECEKENLSVHVSTLCRPLPLIRPIKRKRRHNKLNACLLKCERARGKEWVQYVWSFLCWRDFWNEASLQNGK